MKSRPIRKPQAKQNRRPKISRGDPGVIEPVVVPDVYTKDGQARKTVVKIRRRGQGRRQVRKADEDQQASQRTATLFSCAE